MVLRKTRKIRDNNLRHINQSLITLRDTKLKNVPFLQQMVKSTH